MEPDQKPVEWNLPQPNAVVDAATLSGVSETPAQAQNPITPNITSQDPTVGAMLAGQAQTAPIANDDVSDEEWASRATQIIEQYSDDPYQQSQRISMLKAVFLKKRYNKLFKINE
jgi:hypothetical protein